MTAHGRDGLKRLMSDVVSDPDFCAVLVTDVSRWGRYQDPDEAAHYEFVCRTAGVIVCYCAEAFENDQSPANALLKNLKRMMAAEYSRQLSDRVRAGLRRTVLAGGRSGGRAPYGFSREAVAAFGSEARLLKPGERPSVTGQPVRLVWGSPAEIATLRLIFKHFVDEVRGVPDIVRLLNENNIPYNRAGGWTVSRVKAVLTNEAAVGINAVNRSHWRFGTRDRSLSPSEWVRIQVMSPVISKAKFARAASRLARANGSRFTDEELLESLRRLLKSKGALSRSIISESLNVASPFTYQKRFKSLGAAFRLIGYERPTRTREHIEEAALGRDQVDLSLKRLLAQEGYLSAALIDRCGYLPHSDTLRKRFGKLEELYVGVGYELNRSGMLREAWKRRRLRSEAQFTDRCRA